ncbi:MAG TPA: XdhC family protein, partial [Aquihabitans sp.]|nr:XdhC family protein [Aquihabitans sp.]
MTDVFDAVAAWLADGRAVALGRIVSVEGSAPRGAGAAMAVNDHHEVAGSVSGGCVESALVDAADRVLAEGRPSMAHYAPTDDEWSVGLTCGGEIDVLVEPASRWPADALPALRVALGAGRAVALATVASA